MLACSDADLSALETLALEVDRHASLSTLLAEYDVFAREAQIDRWATLLDVAPFPENVADGVFTSPYYENLKSAPARHEAVGYLAAVALTELAPRLRPGDDKADPAAQLADMLDQASQKLRPGKRTWARVAGLIPTPAESLADDIQTALTERQALIEAGARELLHDAQDAGAAWVTKLGQPGSRSEARERWKAHATIVALYRYRHEVTGTAPLGDAKAVTTADQTAEYRFAQAEVASAPQHPKEELWPTVTHPTTRPITRLVRRGFTSPLRGRDPSQMSFVYRQIVLRCLLKRAAIERTLSPLVLAVLIASTSSGVGGVLGGLLGSVTTSKSLCFRVASPS